MNIYSKSCPHCKTGDLFVEDYIDEKLGRLYFLKCNQCGWEKEITNKIKRFRGEYATSNRA